MQIVSQVSAPRVHLLAVRMGKGLRERDRSWLFRHRQRLDLGLASPIADRRCAQKTHQQIRRPRPSKSFVSLGCPKALVDSERIITRLRAEGYELSREHDGADLVIVNTCGFLDSAQAESLDAIGEALEENGKVIVTGCMGAEPEKITERISRTCSRSPARSNTRAWSRRCTARLPPQHDPFLDLVPPRGHQAHAAALRLSEDFRGLQQPLHLLHHPEAARRSGLAAGRRRAARGRAAGRRRRQGAAGHLAGHVGLRRRHQICREPLEGPRGARQVHRSRARARRARRLGAAALRLSLPACRRGHPADGRAARCCPISTSRSSTPARTCSGA